MKRTEDILPLPRYAFWDVNPEALDIARDKRFIVPRIFERGKLDDVLSTIVLYGKEETGNILQSNKYLNRQGLFLAHALLGLPLEGFKAYVILKHN
ncbi:DUF6922 domain-containing protein [Parafilimonas sp.]|uniref:DUF6922 domain-containing protein n=1 Tax=Parafilimonas sp. TaxID=1969739 RepID=UPI0039E25ED3